MPTKQETFDTVVMNLRRQGKKSKNKMRDLVSNRLYEKCAYRGMDGLKCAAGWLIPDADYQPGWEDQCANHSDVGDFLYRAGYDADFVAELQLVHDRRQVRHWETNWAKLAKKHGLIYTPPGGAFPSQLVQISCPEPANHGTPVAVAS